MNELSWRKEGVGFANQKAAFPLSPVNCLKSLVFGKLAGRRSGSQVTRKSRFSRSLLK